MIFLSKCKCKSFLRHRYLLFYLQKNDTQCSKIRKKVQFQKCKKALFAFSKMAKKIFAPKKSLKLPKMQFFGLKKKTGFW